MVSAKENPILLFETAWNGPFSRAQTFHHSQFRLRLVSTDASGLDSAPKACGGRLHGEKYHRMLWLLEKMRVT